ncbi:hypothetical protein GQ42DRAFT_87967, partial [Ramicandelaber brevisporus]
FLLAYTSYTSYIHLIHHPHKCVSLLSLLFSPHLLLPCPQSTFPTARAVWFQSTTAFAMRPKLRQRLSHPSRALLATSPATLWTTTLSPATALRSRTRCASVFATAASPTVVYLMATPADGPLISKSLPF